MLQNYENMNIFPKYTKKLLIFTYISNCIYYYLFQFPVYVNVIKCTKQMGEIINAQNKCVEETPFEGVIRRSRRIYRVKQKKK